MTFTGWYLSWLYHLEVLSMRPGSAGLEPVTCATREYCERNVSRLLLLPRPQWTGNESAWGRRYNRIEKEPICHGTSA